MYGGKGGAFGLFLALLFGAYLIVVKSLGLISISTAVLASIDKWVMLVAGILLILGGYYFWKDKRY
jgi:hypothetical protein